MCIKINTQNFRAFEQHHERLILLLKTLFGLVMFNECDESKYYCAKVKRIKGKH